MLFEDRFFRAEIKDGFYVSALMKRSWAAILEVVADVDALCRKHNNHPTMM